MKTYTYTVETEHYRCGDGCCDEFTDIFNLFNSEDELVGSYYSYDEMQKELLASLGVQIVYKVD